MARMTLKQAMQVEDLKGLSKKELREILAPIRDAANKRLNRLAEAGLTNAPAFQAAQETGGKIYGSQYNTLKDLRKEIRRGQAIIKYETSTITGTRDYFRRMTGTAPQKEEIDYRAELSDIGRYEDLSQTEDDKQVSRYWNILDKLNELGQTGLSTEMYNTMKALIRDAVMADKEQVLDVVMQRLPASSYDHIYKHIAELGGFGEDMDENIANILDAYLSWRTEYGYTGETDEEKEKKKGPWKVL